MKRALLTSSLLVILAAGAGADPPTITIRKGDRVAVAVESMGAATDVPLRNALQASGAVQVTDPGKATFIVRGRAGGRGLQGEVVDRGGGVALSNSYGGAGRTAAHAFADDLVETLTGVPGFASSKIAFVATRTGRKEVYLCDFDGANLQQLTRDNAISVAPSISADRSLLAYTGYHSGYADIYLINLASGQRSRIIKLPGTNSGAAISPDGRRIAATSSRDGNPELYVFGINGSGARRLTRTPGVETSPTWSPDGSQIIYSSDAGGSPRLFRIAANGGSPTPVSTGQTWATEPTWSPDGRLVAYNVRQGGGYQIAVTDLRSGSTRVITSGANAEDPSWGANSRHLVYAQGGRLILHDYLSGDTTVIAEGLGKISEPNWSR